MTNRSCEAIVRFTLKTDATDEQIISLADAISEERFGERMDSLDLGDSMGVFMRAAHEDFYNGDLFSVFPGDGFLVEMEISHDLFQWKGNADD